MQKVLCRRLFSFAVLTAILILFSFAVSADSQLYCCVGESIAILKEPDETVSYDENYLASDGGNNYKSLKSGTTQVAFFSTKEQEITNESTGQKEIIQTTSERKVTVVISETVKEITLNKSELTLGKGEEYKLKYKLTDGTKCNNVTYASSDENIVKTDGKGNLSAVNTGMAKISVRTSNGLCAKCTVTVLGAPKKVTLNEGKITLGADETFKLKAVLDKGYASYHKSFDSSNSKILSVSPGGTLTAHKTGSATITVKTYNGKTAKCAVTVMKAPKKAALNKNKITLGTGETYKLKMVLNKGYASKYKAFTSSNNKTVSVSSGGTLTARKTGKATITVRTFNGKTSKCTVTVMKAPKKVKLNKDKITLGAGESYKLKAVLSTGYASYHNTFSSSNSKTLSVSSGGTLTAHKTGKAIITVKTYNGKTAKCAVTVMKKPTSIKLNKTSLTLGKGEKFKLSVSLSKGSASNAITYSVSNSNAAISKSGVLTANKVGKVTVTVRTYNNIKSTCKVTIKNAPKKISAGSFNLNPQIGKRIKPKFTFSENAYSNKITCKSSNKSVVEVTTGGYLWAKKIGSAKITAETYNGKKCTFRITVRAMSVPYVSQMPKYPTGCEAASCTSLLRYYGYDITLDQMINTIPREDVVTINGKRYGPSIYEKFVGDPRSYYNSSSPGYGAFSPCVTKSLQKAINARKGKHKAVMMTGCKWSELLSEISNGHPAIVWSTYRMLVPQTVNSWYIKQPDGSSKYFEYPKGTHVTVMTGFSDYSVTILDPINGTETYNIETFINRWNLLGKQAIVLK